jgi:hypothetical protein
MIRVGSRRASAHVGCPNCSAEIESSDEGPDSWDAWNHRPEEDRLRALIAALEAERDRLEFLASGHFNMVFWPQSRRRSVAIWQLTSDTKGDFDGLTLRAAIDAAIAAGKEQENG